MKKRAFGGTMYEPIYQPNLENKTIAIGQIRFGVLHYKGCKQIPDDDTDPLHCHTCTEIYFHVAGDASFLVNGQLYPLQFGDAVVSRSNDLHMCVYEVPGLQEHYCLWIGGEADPVMATAASIFSGDMGTFARDAGRTGR